MPITPVAPIITSVTYVNATITRGADGNPSGTFYSFQLAYNVGLFPQIMYLLSDGSFSPVPIWINTTSLTATNLIPNTLFSVRLAAATDSLGTGATAYGPVTTFTTAAAPP